MRKPREPHEKISPGLVVHFPQARRAELGVGALAHCPGAGVHPALAGVLHRRAEASGPASGRGQSGKGQESEGGGWEGEGGEWGIRERGGKGEKRGGKKGGDRLSRVPRPSNRTPDLAPSAVPVHRGARWVHPCQMQALWIKTYAPALPCE